MVNLQAIKSLVGIQPQDEAELDLHRETLDRMAPKLWAELSGWSHQRYGKSIESLMSRAFFRLLLLGERQDGFFSIVYQQALSWRQQALTETDSMVLLSHLRQQFVDLGQTLDAPRLARALCHNVDMAQTILTAVFQLSHVLARMRERAEFEVRRFEHMFSMIEQPAPSRLIQAYRDHQRWKQIAYELALGETLPKNLELDPARCQLGRWLEAEGWSLIAPEHREAFDEAHRRVHALGAQMLKVARAGPPDAALELIDEMEAASEDVSTTLLEMIDRAFIEVATRDVLTGLPNRHSFEMDYHKALKLARRYDLHLGLHLLDIDHFKKINDTFGHLKGDEVLRRFAMAIQSMLRDDDHLYRWGGEEFAIVTLHRDEEGALLFGKRLFAQYDARQLARDCELSDPITFSMASVELPYGLEEVPPDPRVFAAADQLLYRAKESGRNQLWAGILDDKGHLREDTIHRV